jgi:hypothetical protein
MTVAMLNRANTDLELEQRITSFLFQRHVPGGDGIRLIAHGGVVAVSGRVPTRSAKWLCIECCRRVAGVLRVIDNVTIAAFVNERPSKVPICSYVENQRARTAEKTGVCRNHPIVAFPARKNGKRESFAASSRSRLRAAA